MNKKDAIIQELKDHLPFTFTVSFIVGLIVSGVFLWNSSLLNLSDGLFEFLHVTHILFSASATAAIYYKYNKSIGLSLVIGVFGAILVGTISDVLFPYIAGNLFLLDTVLHMPIFEEPLLILGVSLLGSIFGVYLGGFKISHNLHVLLSILASLFYLLAFSFEISILAIILISVILFLFVFIPCCVSDIIFPLLFLKKPCKEHDCWHEH